jgi:hypothetical protein
LEELRQDFKREIIGIRLRTPGSLIAVTTNAEFVQHLRFYGELEHYPVFDRHLTAIAQPFTDKLTDWESYVPQTPCGERDSQIRTERGGKVIVKGSQSYLTGLNTRIRPLAVSLPLISIPVDRFECVSFLTRKPDVVGYVRNQSGPYAITIFGDAKPYPGLGYSFTEQQIGQVVDMAFEFLRRVQPWRQFIIVFLTDTRRWQFFKVTRNPKKMCGFDTIESSVHIDAAGLAIYIALLCASHYELGYSDRSVDGTVDSMQLIGIVKKHVFEGKLSLSNDQQQIVVLKTVSARIIGMGIRNRTTKSYALT